MARKPHSAMNGMDTKPIRRNHTVVQGFESEHTLVGSREGYHSTR